VDIGARDGCELRAGDAQERGPELEFRFDGLPVRAFAGESVAVALFAAGVRALRVSPRSGAPRGMFCLMGSCQECTVWIDGRRAPACQETARAGSDVRSTDPRGL
jgi:predicted molibdopterin-dependent oxidoreductase YjgC